MAYVIERASRSGTRYVGVYRAADGKYKSAGTYDSHDRAYEVAQKSVTRAVSWTRQDRPTRPR